MNGTYLKFYVHEHRQHHGILLYEWLLERAKKMGIHGGSAFRAIAFELAGNLPVEVVFIVSNEEATQLLKLIEQEKIHVFYVLTPVEYGVINGDR